MDELEDKIEEKNNEIKRLNEKVNEQKKQLKKQEELVALNDMGTNQEHSMQLKYNISATEEPEAWFNNMKNPMMGQQIKLMINNLSVAEPAAQPGDSDDAKGLMAFVNGLEDEETRKINAM